VRISSRRSAARSARRIVETWFSKSVAISERTSASNATRRHDPCASSRLSRSNKASHGAASVDRSRATRAASSTPALTQGAPGDQEGAGR
jgi:hypothetical protein